MNFMERMQIIPSHSAGMAQLRVDWHSPNRLASSLWNAPVARNPSVHITWGHKRRMAPRCCAQTPAAALRIKKWRTHFFTPTIRCIKSQMTVEMCGASCQLQGCCTHFSTAVDSLVCTAPLCACFYIHSCNCRHMGVLIVHQC